MISLQYKQNMFNVGNYMKPKYERLCIKSIPCEISLITLADTEFLEGFPRCETIYIT